MRVMRIDIKGACGKATVCRSETSEIVVNLMLNSGHQDSWVVNGRGNPQGLCEQRKAARSLQQKLDGYQGTEGDVADYARIIREFAS